MITSFDPRGMSADDIQAYLPQMSSGIRSIMETRVQNMRRKEKATAKTASAPSAPAAGGGGLGEEAKALFQQAAGQYDDDGSFIESAKADIAEGVKQKTASGKASAISAGLGGTTVMAGVGTSAKRGGERQLLSAKSEAAQRKADILQRWAGLQEGSRQADLGRSHQSSMQQAGFDNQGGGYTQSALSGPATPAFSTSVSVPQQPMPAKPQVGVGTALYGKSYFSARGLADPRTGAQPKPERMSFFDRPV